MGRNKFTFGIVSIKRYLKIARERLAIIWNNCANNERLYNEVIGTLNRSDFLLTDRLAESRAALFLLRLRPMHTYSRGPFKCYVTQMGVGGVRFSGKKRYEGVRFNVISVTRGWVWVQFPEKKRYVTLEWPLPMA